MTLYRRNNRVGFFGLFLLLCSLLSFTVACDANWTNQAQSIIATLVPAIEGALGLLLVFGVGLPPGLVGQITQVANEIMADLQTIVKPLIDEYNNAPADQKDTVMERIQTALKGISTRFPDILNALRVDNPALQDKLTAIFGAIQSEVMALIAVIPVASGKLSLAAFEEGGGRLPLNAGQFKHYYKTIFKMKTGDASVDKVVEHAPVFGKAD